MKLHERTPKHATFMFLSNSGMFFFSFDSWEDRFSVFDRKLGQCLSNSHFTTIKESLVHFGNSLSHAVGFFVWLLAPERFRFEGNPRRYFDSFQAKVAKPNHFAMKIDCCAPFGRDHFCAQCRWRLQNLGRNVHKPVVVTIPTSC